MVTFGFRLQVFRHDPPKRFEKTDVYSKHAVQRRQAKRKPRSLAFGRGEQAKGARVILAGYSERAAHSEDRGLPAWINTFGSGVGNP